jgi:hypothetical protein
MADRHHAALGRAHQQPRGEQEQEARRQARKERAQREGDRRDDQQDLALAQRVRQPPDEERRILRTIFKCSCFEDSAKTLYRLGPDCVLSIYAPSFTWNYDSFFIGKKIQLDWL